MKNSHEIHHSERFGSVGPEDFAARLRILKDQEGYTVELELPGQEPTIALARTHDEASVLGLFLTSQAIIQHGRVVSQNENPNEAMGP